MVKKQLMLEAAQDLRRLADKVENLAEAIVAERSVKNEDKHKDSKEDVGVSIEGQSIEKSSSEEEHLVPDKNSSEKQDSGKKITSDDITKLIVAKIKKDRNSQESIGKLLAGYGVDHISKIPEEKYEAFIKDLSEI